MKSQFDNLRDGSLLRKEDIDPTTGFLVIDPACSDCPLANKIAQIYSSTEEEKQGWFDINRLQYSARLSVESVYRNCPGRDINKRRGFKKILSLAFGYETPHERYINEQISELPVGAEHYACAIRKK